MNLSIRPHSAFYLLRNSALFYLHLHHFPILIQMTPMSHHPDTSILLTLIGYRSQGNAAERPSIIPFLLRVSITFLFPPADLPAACHEMIPAHLIVVVRRMGSH